MFNNSGNVNCRDLEGRQSTPLHFAAGFNRVEVVEFLLSMGADVQAKDQSQETLVELIGLGLSYFIVSMVGNEPKLVLTIFTLFITLHLFCNYNGEICKISF